MKDRSFTIPLGQDHSKLTKYMDFWNVEYQIFHHSILMIRGELHYQVFEGILSHLCELNASINDAEGYGQKLTSRGTAYRVAL